MVLRGTVNSNILKMEPTLTVIQNMSIQKILTSAWKVSRVLWEWVRLTCTRTRAINFREVILFIIDLPKLILVRSQALHASNLEFRLKTKSVSVIANSIFFARMLRCSQLQPRQSHTLGVLFPVFWVPNLRMRSMFLFIFIWWQEARRDATQHTALNLSRTYTFLPT